MTPRRLLDVLSLCAFGFLVTLLLCGSSFAKDPLPDAPSNTTTSATSPAISPAPVIAAQNLGVEVSHKFWDRQNTILFVANAGFNTGDFLLTRANLQSGGQELNPVVRIFGRSTPGLAVNFAGETAGVIGLSYFFHRTGHHKMERLVSYVNMSVSAGAVGWGMAHR